MKRINIFIVMLFVFALSLVAMPASADYCPWINDGRLNDDTERSCAAPVIIYTDPLTVVVVNPATQQGETLFTVDDDLIEEVGFSEDENLRIIEETHTYNGFPVIISRLTSGEFQLNAFYPNGEGYVVVWNEDFEHYVFTYYPPFHPKYQGD